jgi:phosphoribosyl 1,2-cyclic phosphodiesterase
MKIKLWGVRGSTPAPVKGYCIRDKIRKSLSYASPADVLDEESIDRFIKSLPFSLTHTYGGNTTCLELRNKKNELIIIDGGTGIRDLGNLMMAEGFGNGKGECSIVFTHTHWDHIQGLPTFVPMYIPGNKFHFHFAGTDIEDRIRYQHDTFMHFPMSLNDMASEKHFIEHDSEENWELYGIKIRQKLMRHPGGCYSYRFEEDGKIFIISTDAEFRLDDMENIEEYIEYFSNADVLVFDTQYTFEEQLQKIDWGHSSASIATDLALKAGVKKLILFHHDPSYDDEKLDEVFMRAIRYREMMDPHHESDLEIMIGYEGLELYI